MDEGKEMGVPSLGEEMGKPGGGWLGETKDGRGYWDLE